MKLGSILMGLSKGIKMLTSMLRSLKRTIRFRLRIPKAIKMEIYKNDSIMTMMEYNINYYHYQGIAFPVSEMTQVTQ